MARKRPAWRISATDGLDHIVTLGPPPFRLTDVPTQLLNNNRQMQLHDLEAFWKQLAANVPPNSILIPFSLDWYALDVGARLARLERFKQEHPEHALVVFDAIHAGYKMADAFWRLNRGDQTRTGKKQRSKAPRAGRHSAAERARLADVRRVEVEKEARELRKAHPNTAKLPTYQLAKRLAARLGLTLSTVRSDLERLGLK